jgi:ATP-binding cassette subfamily B (MDR/TAP) protein 1
VEVVEQFGMKEAKSLCLPLTQDLHLCRGVAAGESAPGPYSEAVGCLMTCTRPDLAQSVGALFRFVSDPRKQHWEAVKKVLRYLKGTTECFQGGIRGSVSEKCVAACSGFVYYGG